MKYPKKFLIYISILLTIVVINIGLNLYKKPKNITHTFNSGILLDNSNGKVVQKNIKIDLNAKLYKGDFLFKELKFREDLIGSLTINNKKFKLSTFNLFKGTSNLFWGDLKLQDNQDSPSYIVFISNDFKTIYLNDDKNNMSMASPANNLSEFKKIKDYILTK